MVFSDTTNKLLIVKSKPIVRPLIAAHVVNRLKRLINYAYGFLRVSRCVDTHVGNRHPKPASAVEFASIKPKDAGLALTQFNTNRALIRTR